MSNKPDDLNAFADLIRNGYGEDEVSKFRLDEVANAPVIQERRNRPPSLPRLDGEEASSGVSELLHEITESITQAAEEGKIDRDGNIVIVATNEAMVLQVAGSNPSDVVNLGMNVLLGLTTYLGDQFGFDVYEALGDALDQIEDEDGDDQPDF